MSRKRSISTSMSTDRRLQQLAVEQGDFAVVLYTWMIPHAAEDSSLTGHVEEFMATVIPMRRDKSAEDVVPALDAMHDLGLIIWDKGREIIRFPTAEFYALQSVIKKENRREDWPDPEPPTKTYENLRASTKITAPFPFTSPSPVPSPSPAKSRATAPRSRKKVSEDDVVHLTPGEIDEFAEKYADLPAVRDKIALALAHDAHLKYPNNQRQYLNNWLLNDRAKLPKRGNSNGYRPTPTPEDDDLMAHLEARTARRLGLQDMRGEGSSAAGAAAVS